MKPDAANVTDLLEVLTDAADEAGWEIDILFTIHDDDTVTFEGSATPYPDAES